MKGLRLSRIQSFQRLTANFEEIKMEKDELFDEFYAKLKDIVNSAFNFRETIPDLRL